MTNPPGGGFLFIFGASGGPINLPETDGVFAVETDYVLVNPNNVTFDGTVTTTMTVSSTPEPSTLSFMLLGLMLFGTVAGIRKLLPRGY